VYFWNLARSAWEIRKTQEPGADTMTIGLYHRKMNEGRLSRPFGLSVTFDEADESTIFAKADLGDDPDLAKGLTLKERIIIALKAGALTTKEIAEVMEETQDKLRPILHRFPNTFVRIEDKWGLKTDEA
jgi:hypothetical protein